MNLMGVFELYEPTARMASTVRPASAGGGGGGTGPALTLRAKTTETRTKSADDIFLFFGCSDKQKMMRQTDKLIADK
jgi:hypothetical protein